MSDSLSISGDIDVDSAELPAPLLADRVTDLEGLFLHGRMLGSLRTTTGKLVKQRVKDDKAADAVRDQYTKLRTDIMSTFTADYAVFADKNMPVAPDEATLPQLVLIADQAGAFVDALSDVDSFVLSQQVAAVGLRQARSRAAEEHRRLNSEEEGAEPAPAPATASGSYL